MILKNETTGVSVGVFHLPGRKKPVIGFEEKGVLKVYGTFRDDLKALDFMERLAEFCRATDRRMKE